MTNLPTKTYEVNGQKVKMILLGDTRAKTPAASESEVLYNFLSDLEEDDVFWDIGANTGPYTIFGAPKVSQVHSFEPSPTNFQRLNENVEASNLDNVETHNFGLADEDDTVRFKFGDDTVSKGTGHISEDGDYEADIKRGDELDIEPPTVVKIDVEGAEMKVLRGLEGIIDNVNIIYVEVHEGPMEGRYGDTMTDLFTFMRSNGIGKLEQQDKDNIQKWERS